MELKPKIGVLFLAGDSWWEACICGASEGPYAGFLERVQRDVASLTVALRAEMAVVTSGLLHTEEEVARELALFAGERIDAIILCPIIWTNDAPIVAFCRHAPRVPILLWAYDPYGGFPEYFTLPVWLRASGPVSVQQSSAILRRFGRDYEVVFGKEDDNRALDDVAAFCRAAAVKRSLEGTRIALLPAHCRVVMGSWIDEFHLLEKFGVALTQVSVERYAGIVEGVREAEGRAYVDWLREHARVIDVSEDALVAGARQAIGMARLAEEGGFAGIALEDFNDAIPRVLGYRPHLYHPRLGELGCTVGLESDVPGVLATIIAGRMAGRMGMFNEFFSIDPDRNAVLMGHPGMGELSLGDPGTFEVTPDLEYDASQPRGVWVSYRAMPGRMTFLNLTPEYGQLKSSVFCGEALPGPRIMEGYAHMLVQPDTDARMLFQRVVSRGLLQHWGTVHGDVLPGLRYLFKMWDLDLAEL